MRSLRMKSGPLIGILFLTSVFLPSAQAAATLDLTTVGSSGLINGALFEQNGNGASSGTGTIMSFVRISTDDPIEEGYNTDYRPLQFDENTSATFTHSLLLSDVPIVNKGINYREFRLDINQAGGSNSLISLDTIEIYLGSAGNLYRLSGRAWHEDIRSRCER